MPEDTRWCDSHTLPPFKLFIATPMYGGQCYGSYTDSMMRLTAALVQCDRTFLYYPIFNESLIDRARNVCVDNFLVTDATHVLFVDADIQFKPVSVFEFVALDKDVVCGFYPKKRINWRAVRRAVELGYGRENPEDLAKFGCDMVFTPSLNEDSKRARDIMEPVEIHEGGCGFMLVKRHVFERIRKKWPELTCMRDNFHPGMITCFFDAKINPAKGEFRNFLSEDYDFCRLVREAGMKVWLAPWVPLMHHGYYQYAGSVEAMAALQQGRGPEIMEAAE